MKNNYKKIIITALVCAGGFLFINSASGPGSPSAGSNSVTGAPFGSGSCSNCHGGGSFGTTATVQLISGTTPVVGNYVQGWSYNVRITRGANAAYNALVNAGWGFQITCARSAPTNTNVNTWGSPLPASTINRTVGGRNYIEHTAKLSKATTTLNIPWTGPSGSIGSVTFYLALNNVNGDGGSGTDHPVTASATFTMAPLPVTWLYFNGSQHQNGILLEWSTSAEVDNGYFTIEKSKDGTTFETLTKVEAKQAGDGDKIYNYTDEATPRGTCFYRIKQTDISGAESYFKTIAVRSDNAGQSYTYVHNNEIVVNYEAAQTGMATICLYSMDGRKTGATTAIVYEGMNKLSFAKPEVPGIYLVHIVAGGESVYRDKIMVQ